MSHKSLTLSVVIPAYNEKSHIKECLRALAKQTEMPDEVIVVNNNSTDDTSAEARKFPFVTVIDESQQGIVYARNTGFDQAKSTLIARIDADTIVSSDWVATVKKIANTIPSSDAVTGPCTFRGSLFPPLAFAFHRLIYFWSSRALFGHHILFGSNMFLFQSQWQKVRANVCLTNAIHEDMDLSYHIVASGGNIHFHSDLKASISNRRFHNWGRYPGMWLYSCVIHLPPLRFFKAR